MTSTVWREHSRSTPPWDIMVWVGSSFWTQFKPLISRMPASGLVIAASVQACSIPKSPRITSDHSNSVLSQTAVPTILISYLDKLIDNHFGFLGPTKADDLFGCPASSFPHGQHDNESTRLSSSTTHTAGSGEPPRANTKSWDTAVPLRRIFQRCIFPLLCATAALADSDKTIQGDVVVIGGGSAGTYAAFRLQQEGLSVALLEKNNRLGGHVNTFLVNSTTSFDYGVIFYHNISVAINYFSALGVETVLPPIQDGVTTYANLNGDARATTVVPSTRSALPWNNTSPCITPSSPSSFLNDGFNLPDPVPEDILLSWADFMTKYDLDAASFSAYQINQGVVNEMMIPALYAMKGIYDKALQKLGNEGAFLDVSITKVTRGADGVSVVMQTPSADGKTTTIVQAKKLVIAIPPTLAGLQAVGLDLSPEEELSFDQTSYRAYFDAVLQNTGLPDDLSLTNADFSMPDGVPTVDRVVLTVSTAGFFGVPGLHHLDYSSGREISDADAQAEILATVAKYRAAHGLNTTVEPVFLGFNNHAPFELTVPAEAIRNGYYKQRNALQGRQNAWYTGAAWQAHDSTLIWNFTETAVVQELVKAGGVQGSLRQMDDPHFRNPTFKLAAPRPQRLQSAALLSDIFRQNLHATVTVIRGLPVLSHRLQWYLCSYLGEVRAVLGQKAGNHGVPSWLCHAKHDAHLVGTYAAAAKAYWLQLNCRSIPEKLSRIRMCKVEAAHWPTA
ncbi:hypothetical protein K438DRAFT_1749542 [Mycena galopus ATCC 62051]|nr:hypothetical protein K438DRAFT_1749542 [Mycena galopus ATCC 62051]